MSRHRYNAMPLADYTIVISLNYVHVTLESVHMCAKIKTLLKSGVCKQELAERRESHPGSRKIISSEFRTR